MGCNKTLIATVVAVGLCLGANALSAATVTSWKLTDFDNDGLSSDFAFFTVPQGDSVLQFASGAGDGAPIIMDSGAIGPGVFTAGFTFPSTPPAPAAPFVFGNVAADISGTSLQFSALDFGLVYDGTALGRPVESLNIAPDILANCTTGPFTGSGCGTVGFGYHTEVTDLGGGDFGVVVRYVGTISDSINFNIFQGNWRLEGVMTTVSVPAAAWLFGSGLVGLAAVARRHLRPVSEVV